MRRVLHAGLPLAVVVAANVLAGPPNRIPIERDPRISPKHRERIEALRPEVVLIGNSILHEGVDEDALSALTGRGCLEVWRGGAASAWWYLALKNEIVAASHRVPVVVVVFRDHFLTEPGFRVTGMFRKAIDAIAGADEPVLDRLAYLGGMDTTTYLLNRFVPLYGYRDGLRERFQDGVKDAVVGRALGLAPGGTDAAIERVFARENLDPARLGQRQAESEAPSGDAVYDFAERLPRSFLPEMIELAEAHDVQLVFVRMKRRRDLDPDPAPAALERYVGALHAYLSERGIALLDFASDARLREEHFADGDHLGPAGRKLFTGMLAEALAPHL